MPINLRFRARLLTIKLVATRRDLKLAVEEFAESFNMFDCLIKCNVEELSSFLLCVCVCVREISRLDNRLEMFDSRIQIFIHRL